MNIVHPLILFFNPHTSAFREEESKGEREVEREREEQRKGGKEGEEEEEK